MQWAHQLSNIGRTVVCKLRLQGSPVQGSDAGRWECLTNLISCSWDPEGSNEQTSSLDLLRLTLFVVSAALLGQNYVMAQAVV
jgi:hypothetical protein